MKYQVGTPGRIFVIRFEDGDPILEKLLEVAKKENIRAGIIHTVGGIKNARIVTGPEQETLPPVPVWREIEESHEMTGFGTIFWNADEPRIHFHGAFGKRDAVKVGCLREKAETFLVLEAVVIEIADVTATREFDPASGLLLLKV